MGRNKNYLPKSTVKNFYQLVENGWEPTLKEIKQKYFNDKDAIWQERLAKSLIGRVRRLLKKDDLYFYCVDRDELDDGTIEFKRKYKLLTTSREYFDITNKLWKITNGFRKSCNSVLKSGVSQYPGSLRPLLEAFKYKMEMLAGMAQNMTLDLNNSIKSLSKGEENENK